MIYLLRKFTLYSLMDICDQSEGCHLYGRFCLANKGLNPVLYFSVEYLSLHDLLPSPEPSRLVGAHNKALL